MEPAAWAAGAAGDVTPHDTARSTPTGDGRERLGPGPRGAGFAAAPTAAQAPRAASRTSASSTKPAASRPAVIARGGSGK